MLDLFALSAKVFILIHILMCCVFLYIILQCIFDTLYFIVIIFRFRANSDHKCCILNE